MTSEAMEKHKQKGDGDEKALKTLILKLGR